MIGSHPEDDEWHAPRHIGSRPFLLFPDSFFSFESLMDIDLVELIGHSHSLTQARPWATFLIHCEAPD